MNLQKIMKRLFEFRDARDRKQFHNPKDLAAAISIEAGELQEKFLRKTQEESFDIAKNDPEVADEIADVVNTALLFANICGIDLATAMSKKLDHNEKKYPVDKSKGNAAKYTEL